MGFFSRLFGGGKRKIQAPKITQAPTKTPLQTQAMDKLLKFATERMQDPTKGFEPIAQRTRSRYEQDTMQPLLERFAGMGGGALSSTGFRGSLERGGVDLEEMLASLQSQYGQQALGQYSNIAQMGLQPQFENVIQRAPQAPYRPGFGQALMGAGMDAGLMGLTGGISKLMGSGGGMSRLFRRF